MFFFKDVTQVVSEDWIENLESTIEERTKLWISQFDKITQEKLNFSPESLIVAEQKLLEKYEIPYPLFINENFFFLDGLNTYVGEVFIRNDKVRNLEWKHSKNIEEYYLGGLVCDLFYNSTVTPYENFMLAISEKSGKEIFDYYKVNTGYFIENGDKERKGKNDVIRYLNESNDVSYQHFILRKDDKFNFGKLNKTLENIFSTKKVKHSISQPNDYILELKLNDKYLFHFHLSGEAHVIKESKELAEGYEIKSWSKKTKEEIAQCASRIEFYGDEDTDGQYINEYMFIFDELVKHPSLLIYDTNQGVFYDEI